MPEQLADNHETLPVDALSRYVLHNRTEVIYVLRALRKKRSLITAFFDQGRQFMLTAVLDADDRGLTLDHGSDESLHEAALKAEKLVCTTKLDRVKVQFSVRDLSEVSFEGQPAIRCGLPESLLRLQRREYFRLLAPAEHALKCRVHLPPGTDPRRVINLGIVDISAGGVAMLAPPDGMVLEPGMRFEKCRIDLPAVGFIEATLEVRNVFDMAVGEGHQVLRAGCQFLDMSGTMTNAVQRYIMAAERERRAREAALG